MTNSQFQWNALKEELSDYIEATAKGLGYRQAYYTEILEKMNKIEAIADNSSLKAAGYS